MICNSPPPHAEKCELVAFSFMNTEASERKSDGDNRVTAYYSEKNWIRQLLLQTLLAMSHFALLRCRKCRSRSLRLFDDLFLPVRFLNITLIKDRHCQRFGCIYTHNPAQILQNLSKTIFPNNSLFCAYNVCVSVCVWPAPLLLARQVFPITYLHTQRNVGLLCMLLPEIFTFHLQSSKHAIVS